MDEIRPQISVKNLVENLLFLAGEPLSLKRLTEYLPYDREEIAASLDSLQVEYRDRALKLRFVNGGWELTTDPAMVEEVENFFNLQRRKRLSKAVLETLAVIAYNQPITRSEVDAIRGVQTASTLQKLVELSLIKVIGQKDTLGNPYLYGTTREFLEHFGLGDVSELPSLDFEIEGLEKPLIEKAEKPGSGNGEAKSTPSITAVDFGFSPDTFEINEHAQKKGA